MESLTAEIAHLGDLAATPEGKREAREALATAIGRLIGATPTPRGVDRPPKVWNLTPFYNELHILKIRLREMASWVDEFVVVEASQTFTGRPKPYFLDQFSDEIAPFGANISSVRIDAFPECCQTPWAREFYQRDYAVRALAGRWAPGDVVLVTDADEVVKAGVVERFQGDFANLLMATHSFFLNYCAKPGTRLARRNSGFVCRPQVLIAHGSSHLRMVHGARTKERLAVEDAGWHLTSMGGAAALTEKCQNFAHQEADKARWRDLEHNRSMLESIQSGRVHPVWERRAIDATFPAYIQEHQDELRDLIL